MGAAKLQGRRRNFATTWLLLLIAACGCRNKTVQAKDCAWNNCPSYPSVGATDSDGINVHLICHTHDDLGWIVNVDEYFSRLRPEIHQVGVEYIYNTVLIELERDPTKRFSFAETGYLTRWVESHDEHDRNRLAKLIASGQIEIIGGGWVQPDEAASHYVDLIDQYTLGLRKLNESYGECGRPKVAWQIDPFGHSREHANLAAAMGYEALFFARLHYLEHENRLKNKSLEFVWATSDDIRTNQILTGQFYEGKYEPPSGYCFDIQCRDKPVVTAPQLQGYNIGEKVNTLMDFVKGQVKAQRHNNVMVMMGGDFHYSDANLIYTNIDKLIEAANARTNETKVTFHYSTPSCYVKALAAAAPRLPQRSDDTFPHATANHSYWTGYFTSKPVMKGLVRSSSAFLQLVRTLDALALLPNDENADAIEKLERAAALAQHHDAVTGTSKENVTQDYQRRLLQGWEGGQKAILTSVKKISNTPENVTLPQPVICLLSNESICAVTKTEEKVAITIYNSFNHPSKIIARIPFYTNNATLRDRDGNKLDFDLQPTFIPKNQLPSPDAAPYEIQFPVTIPALGYKTYFLRRGDKIGPEAPASTHYSKAAIKSALSTKKTLIFEASTPSPPPQSSGPQASAPSISNGFISLLFDATGHLVSYTNLLNNKTEPFKQEFLFYKSHRKEFFEDQASGAYIFRPDGPAVPVGGNITIEVVKGKYIQEVRQVINPWISQVIRLHANLSYVEFDWIIGPILKEEKNPIGREIITRYTLASIKNNGIFQTDSNGRQLMKRVRNTAPYHEFEVKSEPISANYFPVSSRISIDDASGGPRLTVLTDRSQGGSSLADGEVELMIHRRMYEDDNFGVVEALDEPGTDGRGLVVRGKHLVTLGTANSVQERKLTLKLFHEPVITYSPMTSFAAWKNTGLFEFTGLARDLPDNVHILTLKRLSNNTVLIRLEHFLQNGEDALLSQPTTVDLEKLFTTFDIISVTELTLAGNSKIGETRHLPQSWNRSVRIISQALRERFAVQLRPMEIRTLSLEVNFRPPTS
uniref:Alpha-mannosidase n=1 Tax=Panagrellus redivivus TaxID=6233 RepID=A0A7E4VQL4_PANRE